MKTTRTTTRLSRRSFLVSGLTLPLAACELPYGLDMKTVKTAAAVAVGLEDPPGITVEQAAKVPFASMGLRIGHSGERMLVLATDNHGERLWTSSERQALITRNGRIIKTAGLPWNLSNMRFPGGDPLVTGLQNPFPQYAVLRLADFKDIHRYDVAITGHLERKGLKMITILGAELPTLMVVEHCQCEVVDWEFTNIFWVDRDSGFVWRSTQSIHPNLPPFTINMLRPPG